MFTKLVPAHKASRLTLALVVAFSCIAFMLYALAGTEGGGYYADAPTEKCLSTRLLSSVDVLGESRIERRNNSDSRLIVSPSLSVATGSVKRPAPPASGGQKLENQPTPPAAPNASFRLDSTAMLTDGNVLQPVGLNVFGRVGKVLYADLHKVAKFFGYQVKRYEESGFYAVFKKNEDASVFVIKSNFAHIHGEDVTTEGALVEHEGRIYAPLSAILMLEKLSYKSNDTGDIVMNKDDFAKFSKMFPLYRTNPAELKDFARLLYFEARDGTIIKKMAVASVVMNRVHSPRFHSTIHDVIFAPNQFPPAYYASFSTLEPEASYYEAARRVLNGENTAPECLFFNLVPFYGKEADFYKNIEGDYFYR